MKVNKEPTWNEISQAISLQVQYIGNAASLPTVTLRRAIAMLQKARNKYRNIQQSYESRKNVHLFKKHLKDFHTQGRKLFNISECKKFHRKKTVFKRLKN